MAAVLRKKGYSVTCPSLSFNAVWSSEGGKQVLSRTINYIEAKYPSEKILYVGLSNGAMGITKYRNWLSATARGFILISGGEALKFGDSLPTLLIWGEDDQNAPFDEALKIKNLNSNATLLSLKDDHSVFVRQHEYFAKQIESWLQTETR